MGWKEFFKPSKRKLMHSSVLIISLIIYLIGYKIWNIMDAPGYQSPNGILKVLLAILVTLYFVLNIGFTILAIPLLPFLDRFDLISSSDVSLLLKPGGGIIVATLYSIIIYCIWSWIEYKKRNIKK